MTGNAGKDAVGIPVAQLFQRKICRNDGRFFSHMAFIQQGEKPGCDKLIGQFRSQIVDNEQIALIQIGVTLPFIFFAFVVERLAR